MFRKLQLEETYFDIEAVEDNEPSESEDDMEDMPPPTETTRKGKGRATPAGGDRKSTRLNSSHSGESRMPSSA